MLVEKIIKNIQEYPKDIKIDHVYYEWFEQNKKILKKTSEAGEEVGLRLEVPLCDGDVLFENETQMIVASLKPCELIRVSVSNMIEMGEVCFALGNRHLPLNIDKNHVRVPYDSPTFDYLTKLGFSCERVLEKFNHFHEVKAHEHVRSHDHGSNNTEHHYHGHSHG